MNKKINGSGFTLIELLAIIVILGIIAVIAVPTVKKLTDEAKLKAFENTARGIIKAGNLYYSRKDMMDELNGDMTFSFPDNAEELELQGKLPENGSMIINEDGDIALAISNKKYCITKRFDTNDIEIKEDYDSCKIIASGSLNALVTTSTDVTEVPKCVIEDTKCEAGTPVAVKVNEKNVYNFYIIEDTETEVTLIMDRNLGETVGWYAGSTNNRIGPVTALNYLNTQTKNWTNIKPIENYIYINNLNGTTNTYGYQKLVITNGIGVLTSQDGSTTELQETSRARLLTYEEADPLKTNNNGKSPTWLYGNLSSSAPSGYWWLTSSTDNYYYGKMINYNGNYLNDDTRYSTAYGVRPVITLVK